MKIAGTSDGIYKINYARMCILDAMLGYMRKGKGRPDITELMFYSGYNIHVQAAIFETGAFNNYMRWYFYHSILLYLSQGEEGFQFFFF